MSTTSSEVAQAVEVVEHTRAAPVFRQPRCIQRVAVREDRAAGRRAVTNIGVSTGAVRFAYSEAQAVISGK